MVQKHPRWVQAILLYFTLANSLPGIWAFFMPVDFYSHFPGFGHSWVAVDGPYNEHLIRDVGAFFLAFTGLSSLALFAPHTVTARAVAISLLLFNIPHLWYHVQHLHMLSVADQIGNVVTLSLSVLLLIPLLFYKPHLVQPQHA
ncbi:MULTISPECIES: hypothetical protein [unclassified Spirosoma]|uniref:hypothetical protein n=1 Tax=unclassified Spirosoma TaxID=2621999 RepID=UPI000B0144B6|nr:MULTISPECIES: hypothetical protein [unclassified Spirosoma]MBN8821566.1 hypothetical protein [Spirosoma sp.]